MDARNDALYLINKDRALADILAESPKVHQQLVTALASLNTGQINDPTFLLDAGADAANMFIPGANLAKIVIVKGLKLGAKT